MADSDEGSVSRRDALRLGAATGVGLVAAPGIASGADEPVVRRCEHTPGQPATAPPPGPAVLYEAPVTAPQFENAPESGWEAAPLGVCGAQAYDRGEFLYQDWVFDDYGANVDPTDTDPQPPTATTLAAPVGDVVYPTDDARYRDNAADLLEFRCRSDRGGVRYRVTLNTLVDGHADAPIVAVGIDTGEAETRTDWGFGLGELGAPVTHVLVLGAGHGVLAGPSETTPIPISVDTARNQLEGHVDLAPDGGVWRHYCVAGIHDGAGGFAPVRQQADATHPGGARGQDPPPVLNAAFRDEPLGDPHHWRDQAQADALAARDIAALGADIDFGRLADPTHVDRSQADPAALTGYVNRVFSSRISIDGQTSYDPGEEGVEDDGDDAVLTGPVQPYSVYVPDSYDPADPGPLHVLAHSLGQSYNQYAGNPNILRQLGEQRDAIVLMFEGRGPAGWWHDEAEFDLFEAWNDFRQHYSYDADRVTLGGYSMGGYATYRLASLYPDLFAAGFEIVGPPDEDILGGPTDERAESEHNTLDVTDNMRHVPLLMWHGTNDELVPLPGPVNYAQDLREHGYRHELHVFPGFDHFLFSELDEWGPGRAFLEDWTVTRTPARVTYRSKPAMGHAVEGSDFSLAYDSAYWLSDIAVAAPESDDGGLVDAISYGNGYEPPATEDVTGVGTTPAPHVVRGTRWSEPLDPPRVGNTLALSLTGVTGLTVWIEEAGLSLGEPLSLAVETDVAVVITLTDGRRERVVEMPPGTHDVTVADCSVSPGPDEPPGLGGVPPDPPRSPRFRDHITMSGP